MDCAEIRRGFETGGIPSGTSVDEHRHGCAHCAELFRDGAALGRLLSAAASLPVKDTRSQLLATEGLLEAEQGVLAFLRSRPTRLRWGLSLTLPAVLLVLELALARVEWRAFSTPRLLAGLSLVALLGLVVVGALRPMPLVPRAGWWVRALALFAWCLPCALWLTPEARSSTSELSAGGVQRALGCFVYGSALAAPLYGLLWAFDRGVQLPLRARALGAGSVALLANLILLLHCPNNDNAHCGLGHFSIGLVWLLAVSLLGRRFQQAH